MRRTKQNGCIVRHRGSWWLRYRERVGTGGVVKIVNRAKRLAPIDYQHKTKANVRQLAKDFLEPLNTYAVSPLSVTTLADFVQRLYLPHVRQQKKPSTYRGYTQMCNRYLQPICAR